MSGHTPGPWRLPRSQKRSNFGARRIVIDNWPGTPRRYIAEVLYREPNPEAEANARLIAAAPDLYAALGRLLNLAEQSWRGNSLAGPVMAEARAALVKASPAPVAAEEQPDA